MRKYRPIDSLISPIKQSILEATYGQPERWWYLSELASFAGKGPSSLQRELQAMSASGILESKRDGGRLFFRAAVDSPLFEPLRLLIERSVGLIDQLTKAFEDFKHRLNFAFVYGSVARRDDRPTSDVDIIIIGEIGLSDLVPVIRPLENRFQRDINVKCYQPSEFKFKLAEDNHFVVSMLEGPKIFLVGDETELARFCGKRLD